jgi:hypothetical protein
MKKFISILLLTFILSVNVFAKEVAVVVFNQSYLSQTSGNQTITLFTPTETAVYRVSIYIDSSTSNGNINAAINFTGTLGSSTFSQNISTTNNTNAYQTSILVRAIASNAISLAIITGNPTPSNYDIYVTVEEL